MPGKLTLIGSGETAAGMVKVHRRLLQDLSEGPRLAFLDTPAGFELGVDVIAERVVDYFSKRFGLDVAVVHHRRADDDVQSQAAALNAIRRANYILAGPGSPSYAARQWKQSTVFRALVERWQAGAQLVLASSAAIAISRHVLPVYEIYKVGEALHWCEGVDLLGAFGFALAIVTHWDNAEGGTHDTRACFMGMDRMERLRALLPLASVVLGVDEHTACTLDLEGNEANVLGRGGVTILQGQGLVRHPSGSTFPLSDLVAAEAQGAGQAVPEAEGRAPRAEEDRLAGAAERLADGDLPGSLRQAAQTAPSEMAILLHQVAQSLEAEPPCDEAEASLLELLVDVRAGLRQAGQWALADALRDRLAGLGYEIHDTPDGTVWEKM
jgi:cyanophycinase-like exopeptidase